MEKLVLKNLLPVVLLSSVVSCAPKVDKNTISPMKVVSGDVTVEDNGRASGTGIMKFETSLDARDSVFTIDLEGSLTDTGSQIAVISHAQSADLSDGLRVTFTRTSSDRVQCAIQVGTGLISGVQSSRMLPVKFNAIALTLEIHNQWPRSHVIAWPLESPRETGGLALFDTDYAAHLDAPLNDIAPGLDIGLKLKNAVVTRARIK